MVEASVALIGLNIAKKMVIPDIIIEGDSQNIVEILVLRSLVYWSIRNIILDATNIL